MPLVRSVHDCDNLLTAQQHRRHVFVARLFSRLLAASPLTHVTCLTRDAGKHQALLTSIGLCVTTAAPLARPGPWAAHDHDCPVVADGGVLGGPWW
jgi:hypothetical protein